MKLKDKVVEALKEDAESDSGFLSGFSKLDLCFNDSFVTINGATEVGHVRYSQIANVMLETLNLNPDDEYEEPELLNPPAPPKQEKPETAMGFLEQLSNLRRRQKPEKTVNRSHQPARGVRHGHLHQGTLRGEMKGRSKRKRHKPEGEHREWTA